MRSTPARNTPVSDPRKSTQQSLLDTLGPHFIHAGDLFQPTAAFYDLVSNKSTIQQAARQLYGWLGVKPRLLKVSHSDTTSVPAEGELHLDKRYAEHPYQLACLLMFCVIEDVFCHRYHLQLDRQTVEKTSIWCGFGLVALNGLARPRNILTTLHHQLNGDWHIRDGISFMSADNCADRLVGYIKESNILISDAYEHLSPEARHYLDFGYFISHPKKAIRPQLVVAHHEAAKRRWITLTLQVIAITAACILLVYILGQKTI